MDRREFISTSALLAAAASSERSRSQANGHDDRAFALEAVSDFPDDAMQSVITPEHVDAMMATLRSLGVSRLAWMYYGDAHGGYFIPAHVNESFRSYAETLRRLGDPLAVASEAAHRHGIELYAYWKPYETGPAMALPDGSPEGREYGRLKQLGAWLTWLDPFVVEHPELRIRHKDDESITDLSGVAVRAIKLSKKDDSPTRVTREHLRIWSSKLNYRYQQLDINFAVRETVAPSAKEVLDFGNRLVTRKGDPVRTLTLSGFELTDPYILVTTDFTDEPADFENVGNEIMTALDADGNEIPGVFYTRPAVWLDDRVDFRNWGLIFDAGYGVYMTRLDAPNGSGREGVAAFTRGRNKYLPGALCEAEPRVRAYWLSCVQEMLDAGVDGVDFRVENHSTHTHFAQEYGFNPAVLAECERRGSTDLETIAQVRAEAYTEFLRQAKRLIASRGKRMRVMLNIDWFRPDPLPSRRLAYPANVHYDWRRWVDEGLLDEGILRLFEMPFDAIFDDAVAGEMIARCQEKGIPVTLNRYIGPHSAEEFERVRGDGRFSGFILYETASFLRWDAAAGCFLDSDVVAEISQKHAGGQ